MSSRISVGRLNGPFRLLTENFSFADRRRPAHRTAGPTGKRFPDCSGRKSGAADDVLSVKVTKWPSRQAMAAKQSEAPLQTATIRSNKEWFEWAKKTSCPTSYAEHGWKKRYAEKLAGRMKVDVKATKILNPGPSATIIADYAKSAGLKHTTKHDKIGLFRRLFYRRMSASMRKHIETTNPELNDRIAVSLDRAADILNVGKSTIYQLLRERRLRSIRFGTSHRVTMDSIRELVAAAERQSA